MNPVVIRAANVHGVLFRPDSQPRSFGTRSLVSQSGQVQVQFAGKKHGNSEGANAPSHILIQEDGVIIPQPTVQYFRIRSLPADFRPPMIPETFTQLQRNIWNGLMIPLTKLCRDPAREYDRNPSRFLKDLNQFMTQLEVTKDDGKSGARVVAQLLDPEADYVIDTLFNRVRDFVQDRKNLSYNEMIDLMYFGEHLQKLEMNGPPYRAQFRKIQEVALDVMHQRAWMEVFDESSLEILKENQGYWNMAQRFNLTETWSVLLERIPKALEGVPNKLFDLLWPTHEVSTLPIKQGTVGDCYLLSALLSLNASETGRTFLKDFIKKNIRPAGEDAFIVSFPGVIFGKEPVQVRVSISDLVDQVAPHDFDYGDGIKVKKGEALKHAQANLFVKIMERAYGRMRQCTTGRSDETLAIVAKGHCDQVYRDMGISPKVASSIAHPRSLALSNSKGDVEKALMFKANHPNALVLGLATPETGSHPELPRNHAYAVESVDPDSRMVRIINPHNSEKPVEMSIEEVLKNFGTLYYARLGNVAKPAK